MLTTLTRGQIKAAAFRRARLFDGAVPGGNDGSGDPDTADEMLEEVVDDITRVTQGAYLSLATNLVSGQAIYCRPEIDEILNVHIMSSDGSGYRPLAVLDEITANLAVPDWQTRLVVGDPTYAFLEGQNQVHLYGTPNFAATNGLIIRGFGSYSRALWPNDTDPAPFRDRWISCITNGLTWKLCRNESTPEFTKRAMDYFQSFSRERGYLESEMATESESRRSRGSITPPLTSWSSSDVGNPLNM